MWPVISLLFEKPEPFSIVHLQLVAHPVGNSSEVLRVTCLAEGVARLEDWESPQPKGQKVQIEQNPPPPTLWQVTYPDQRRVSGARHLRKITGCNIKNPNLCMKKRAHTRADSFLLILLTLSHTIKSEMLVSLREQASDLQEIKFALPPVSLSLLLCL